MKQEEAKLEYAKIKLDETNAARRYTGRKDEIERNHYDERRELSERQEQERRELSERQEQERRELSERQEQERRELKSEWQREIVQFAERIVALRQKAVDEGIEVTADTESL